jgi:hypothetical protein
MFPNDSFPLLTNASAVFIIFIIAIVCLHAVLVFWLKLGKRAWKAIDYVWLGFAALGLIGAAGQARQELAQNRISFSESRADGMYSLAKSLADSYSKDPGAVCRKFIRGQYSPPEAELDRTQHEYDLACEWFKSVAMKLPLSYDRREITNEALPPDPVVTAGDLKDILAGFHKQVDYYNVSAKQHAELLRAATHSDMEITLTMLSPLLLALALALRITKVTGEIRLT